MINNDTFINALKVSKELKCRLFTPSSISSYGFKNEKDRMLVTDKTYQRPNYLYGITKVYMELMGNYYAEREDVDFRSIRYPGIVSKIIPIGGTTDFAIRDFIRHGIRSVSW